MSKSKKLGFIAAMPIPQVLRHINNFTLAARNKGAAMLLLSEDLDEILELSDRFYVISTGRLVYETTPEQTNMNVIGQYMAGH